MSQNLSKINEELPEYKEDISYNIRGGAKKWGIRSNKLRKWVGKEILKSTLITRKDRAGYMHIIKESDWNDFINKNPKLVKEAREIKKELYIKDELIFLEASDRLFVSFEIVEALIKKNRLKCTYHNSRKYISRLEIESFMKTSKYKELFKNCSKDILNIPEYNFNIKTEEINKPIKRFEDLCEEEQESKDFKNEEKLERVLYTYQIAKRLKISNDDVCLLCKTNVLKSTKEPWRTNGRYLIKEKDFLEYKTKYLNKKSKPIRDSVKKIEKPIIGISNSFAKCADHMKDTIIQLLTKIDTGRDSVEYQQNLINLFTELESFILWKIDKTRLTFI